MVFIHKMVFIYIPRKYTSKLYLEKISTAKKWLVWMYKNHKMDKNQTGAPPISFILNFLTNISDQKLLYRKLLKVILLRFS